MSKIHYLVGDATDPGGVGFKIIPHICNNFGGWSAGFVVALSKKWRAPEESYRKWHADGDGFELGRSRLVPVEDDIQVCNMIAQIGHIPLSGMPPIRYFALGSCLNNVAAVAGVLGASVHMPRIGCGLAGGKWEVVEAIIEETLVSQGIDVYVYDLEEARHE